MSDERVERESGLDGAARGDIGKSPTEFPITTHTGHAGADVSSDPGSLSRGRPRLVPRELPRTTKLVASGLHERVEHSSDRGTGSSDLGVIIPLEGNSAVPRTRGLKFRPTGVPLDAVLPADLTPAGAPTIAGSETVLEMIVRSEADSTVHSEDSRVSIRDYRSLVSLSVSGIACFEIRRELSVEDSIDDVLAAIWGGDTVCVEANATFARLFGLGEIEDTVQTPFSWFFPRQSESDLLLHRWGESNFFLATHEFPLQLPDGEVSYFDTSLYTTFEGRRLRKIWVVLRDVTALRRALAEVTRAEEHYRTLVERPGLILVRARPDGRYLYLSPHVEDIVGYSRAEFERTPGLFARLLHPDDITAHDVILEARRERSTKIVEAEYRVRRKDGQYHWFFERMTPKLDARGEVEFYDSVAFDIQHRKQLEQQIEHAQRMEIVGTLSQGIAHDFNNHLTAILGQLSLALQDLGPDHTLYHRLALTEKAALCCAEMTRHLLSFGRKGDHEFEPLDLNGPLRETASLLRHLLPTSIAVRCTTAADLPAISGNFAQLQQVIMNLAVNSRDAMPRGGELHITTRLVELEDSTDRTYYSHAPAGQYVELSVQDSGTGIAPEILPKIFEPFFTTKSRGEGTGLGLSMVYSIIQAHHGHIDARSAKGKGTTIRWIIPALTVRAATLPTPPPQLAPRGTECILVADDDDLVRAMATTVLTSHGYSVIQATDGEDALRLFAQHRESISLAFVDQTMPRLSGREVLDQLKRLAPQLPIILTSGYALDAPESTTKSGSADAFLRKPYAIGKLLEQVRSLIDREKKLGAERDRASGY